MKTYLLGVLALVGMMLWDVAQRWTQPPARQLAENSGMEGALDHAESAFFAPDGNRRYTLESVRLSYSTDENQAHSGRLRLVYDMPADKSMLLTAATGTVRDGGDTVTLGGTVVIQHWLSDTELYETARTRDLTIDVPMQTARTDAGAVIERQGRQLTGDGLVIDLEKASMRLLHNVKAHDAR